MPCRGRHFTRSQLVGRNSDVACHARAVIAKHLHLLIRPNAERSGYKTVRVQRRVQTERWDS